MNNMDYLEKLKERQALKKKLVSKEHVLADEIYEFFDKKLGFGTIMGIIRNKGFQAVYEIFQETKKSKWDHTRKLPLFLSLVKKEKIKWLDENSHHRK